MLAADARPKLPIYTQSKSTPSHSVCFLSRYRPASFQPLTLVSTILGLFIFVQLALVSTASAQTCQYSPYWGQYGELWNPNGSLKDYSYVGYHSGEDPIPYRQRSATLSFGEGRYEITKQIILTKGVLRGAGKDKTVLYFPKSLRGMGVHPCESGSFCNWTYGVIEARGSEIGIEDVTIEFPSHKYNHLNGEGFNGPALYNCVNCWMKNVKVINADVGISITYGHHNTLDGVDVSAYHFQLPLSLTAHNLITNFKAGTGWHGIGANWDAHHNVYANGQAPLIEATHSCPSCSSPGPASTELLFSNIQSATGIKFKQWFSQYDHFAWNVGNQNLCPLDIHQAQLASRLGTGLPPMAAAGLDQTVFMGEAVTFDGRGSSDPDGDALTYSWNLGDGTMAPGAVVTHTYTVPGTYTATLTVSDGTHAASDTAKVTVLAAAPGGYAQRVNAGGSSYTDSLGQSWAADQPYKAGSWGYGGGSTYSNGNAIADTVDDKLYQSERYGTFSYHFDVPNGTYQVVLEFAEIYHKAAGKRVFDVAIEGSVVLDNYDIYAEVGGNRAVGEAFVVLVSDGRLSIDFISPAKVSAIAVLGVDEATPNTPPVASAGGDQTVLVGAAVTLDGRSSDDPDGDPLTYSWDLGDGTMSTGAVVTHTYAVPGIYTVTLTVSDGTLTASDTAEVTVLAAAPGGYVQRVNAGGSSYTDSLGQSWAADQPYKAGSWGYGGGSTYSNGNAIADTIDDKLYQSERYGTFSYHFDVPNGTYQVVLEFAEIYHKASGKRVFDVAVEGSVVLDNYDIYAEVGGNRAVGAAFVVLVSDGRLSIDFISPAKVSAIAVQAID